MKPILLTFTLFIVTAFASASAITFADHNFTIEIPSDWQQLYPPPAGTLMLAQSQDKLKTIIVVASKLPASERSIGISEALAGAKDNVATHRWLIDDERSLMVNGIPFRFVVVHKSSTNTMAVYAAVAGDELYMLDPVFNAGDASTEPEIQSVIQSFHLITAVDVPVSLDNSMSPARNRGYRQGYMVGQLLVYIGLPICGIVWLIRRLLLKPKA